MKPIHAKPSLYAFYYESMKIIAKDFGYNLVLHGSMNRDLDLIAIPWVDDPKDELEMIQELNKMLDGKYFTEKRDYLFSILPGGRKSYVININRHGKLNENQEYVDPEYYIDISITPIINK